MTIMSNEALLTNNSSILTSHVQQSLKLIGESDISYSKLYFCFEGNYFGTHFIMGGERFDMSQPEAYLFGDNSDLNFLGSKPIPVSARLYLSFKLCYVLNCQSYMTNQQSGSYVAQST